MTPEAVNYLYYATIALVGLVMYKSPTRFLGKAKFDEGAVKTEKLVKRCGATLMIFMVALSIYSYFFK